MNKYNFLARGGELYYLHILQVFQNEDTEKRDKLEKLLSNMLTGQSAKLSKIAFFVQDSWEKEMGFDKTELIEKLKLAYIPANAYLKCESNTINELINYLSAEIHPITRIDILAKGVMFQVMRMLAEGISSYLGIDKKPWIIDMKGGSTDTVKKLANKGYKAIEADFLTAINKVAVKQIKDQELKEEELFDAAKKAKNHSFDIFKAKGKEMQCIIPVKGAFERMTLSEDIIRFLVLSIIAPGDKMTVTSFLNQLYLHFGIVIGPEEYKKSASKNAIEENLANSFMENVLAFQQFLKNTGFLRELSDATSIVINPYRNILEG